MAPSRGTFRGILAARYRRGTGTLTRCCTMRSVDCGQDARGRTPLVPAGSWLRIARPIIPMTPESVPPVKTHAFESAAAFARPWLKRSFKRGRISRLPALPVNSNRSEGFLSPSVLSRHVSCERGTCVSDVVCTESYWLAVCAFSALCYCLHAAATLMIWKQISASASQSAPSTHAKLDGCNGRCSKPLKNTRPARHCRWRCSMVPAT